jgi:hypothetical protein
MTILYLPWAPWSMWHIDLVIFGSHHTKQPRQAQHHQRQLKEPLKNLHQFTYNNDYYNYLGHLGQCDTDRFDHIIQGSQGKHSILKDRDKNLPEYSTKLLETMTVLYLSLGTRGNVTQIGLVLFALCNLRLPRQMQYYQRQFQACP